jgi:hypothetical protein
MLEVTRVAIEIRELSQSNDSVLPAWHDALEHAAQWLLWAESIERGQGRVSE